jgi:hypothetical protein
LVAAFFAVTAEPDAFELDEVRYQPPPRSGKTRVRADRSHAPARVVARRVRASDIVNPERDKDPFAMSEIRFLLPRVLTAQIATQGGLFSVHPNPDEPWREPLESENHAFDIPGEMRGFFQRKLFYLGVDQKRIMGGPRRAVSTA